ncbi:MAG TPA: URC4/urg3 family protein [Kofleriaceae bacterium]|nr:URC4/urg3 family protein [Kofleriaceae bacterium]
MPDAAAAIAYLRSPLAVRARCEAVFDAGLAGALAHFRVELDALPAVVDKVVAVTRAAYPSGKIPVHGRTNHFRAGGIDRAAAFEARLAGLAPDERARAWVDLIVVSVLLDAGAGDAWRYREPGTGVTLARSEGLAVASLHAFEAGVFSSDPAHPLAADAAGLRALDPDRLARAFQVTADNPIAGFEGRAGLVRALGDAVAASPRWFPGGRPGGLVDSLGAAPAEPPDDLAGSPGAIDAAAILRALLEGLAPIWPGRVEIDGVNLGDVWPHPAAGGSGPSAGLVPFHKLSQWLAYSLFEPLERAGKTIARPGALTGLPEYRNGGLLVDLGVIVPRRPDIRTTVHAAGDEVIVEWRALTVALLDRVAEGVRERLGKSPAELPLACVLEGGTWAAGRAVAAERRPGGGPPIQIRSDGTVF